MLRNKRLPRFLLAGLLLTCGIPHADPPSIGQKLKGYEFERKKVVLATRSIILDYLKNGQMDSLKLAVAYCDSLTSPDSTWLSASERHCIYFLCADTGNLYKLDFYSNSFSLYDTTQPLQALSSCKRLYSREGVFTPGFAGSDNLEQILFKTCKNRLPDYRKKFPGLDDVWDFWELVVLQPCANQETQKTDLMAFRKKHPVSPLSRLKVSDYREMQKIQRQALKQQIQKRSTNGGAGMIGAGYTSWLDASTNVYPNPLNFTCSIDMIFDNILYQFNADKLPSAGTC